MSTPTAPAVQSRADDRAPHTTARPAGEDDLATIAWLSALPCMAIVALAALLLGPPLGELLAADPTGYSFFPEFLLITLPEPTEQARYLIALSLPLLISLATVVASRRLPRPLPRWSAPAAVAAQALLGALLAACFVAQAGRVYGAVYNTRGEPPFETSYFTTATLVAAALVAAATLVVLRRERLRTAAAALLRESRGRRLAALLLAVTATAIWLLHAVQSDASLASAPPDLTFHLAYTIDETFAVLNGMSPLVDFSAQYGSLWPYPAALVLHVFGETALVYTLAMCALTGLALLAIYSVLKRVTRSSLGALLLYLPFLATSMYQVGGTFPNRSSVATYYGTFPLRYALPCFLAFLVARHIARAGGTASTALLFLVGGLAVLNNGDFGIAALGATVAALIWSSDGRPPRPARGTAAAAAGGLLGALALVSLLTLVRTGELPHLDRLVDYARMFATAGFGMLPLPGLLGLHLVIYLTYVVAIVVATVRALGRASDRLLTGMLAWAGVFGLGSASYFVGRSHPTTLKFVFPAWALALALLTVVVVRHLSANPRRRPTIAAVATLFGFGIAVCSLAQTPAPWTQLDRLAGPFPPSSGALSALPLVASSDPAIRRFVASLADGPGRYVYKRGAPVALLLPSGHRIAEEYGIRNVSAYTGIGSTPTVQRLEGVLDELARAGGNTVILPNPVDAGMFEVLERRGFRLVTHRGLRRYDPSVPHSDAVMPRWPYDFVLKWVDTRHLHPRALDP